jgi:hypothetical protein
MVHFTAQTINVHIHDVGCGINPHPPDVVQNHGASYYATFIPAKIFQQRKLLGGQLQQVITPSCFTTYQVKLQVGSLQTHRFILWDRGPSQEISQSCQQFREGKWFRKVVVSAPLQSPNTLVHRTPGRQDQDGCRTTLGAATGNQVQAIQVWEAKVDNEGIVNAFQGRGFPGPRVTSRIHLVSGFHQRPPQELLNGHIIFYQQ